MVMPDEVKLARVKAGTYSQLKSAKFDPRLYKFDDIINELLNEHRQNEEVSQ
jgi:hypothetical protein